MIEIVFDVSNLRMFIIVKSGDEQERLFNTNCQIDALLRDITNRCPHKVEDEGEYAQVWEIVRIK